VNAGSPSSAPNAVAPNPLRWAIALVAVQTAAVWAYVVFLGYESATRPVPGAVQITGFFALCGLAFAGLGWALLRRRRWARAPMIVLQLLLVAVGYYMIQGGLWWLGAIVVASAVTCAGLLLTRATRDALGIE
jgi:hypothetical protein